MYAYSEQYYDFARFNQKFKISQDFSRKTMKLFRYPFTK